MFRVPAGVGCLVALLAVPLAIFAAMVAMLRALLHRGPSQATWRRAGDAGARPSGFGRRTIGGSAADTVLCEFVEKMSLDEEFAVEDAQTAGLPLSATVTVEGLIEQALARGWVERRGERYAVTSRGRSEARHRLHADGY